MTTFVKQTGTGSGTSTTWESRENRQILGQILRQLGITHSDGVKALKGADRTVVKWAVEAHIVPQWIDKTHSDFRTTPDKCYMGGSIGLSNPFFPWSNEGDPKPSREAYEEAAQKWVSTLQQAMQPSDDGFAITETLLRLLELPQYAHCSSSCGLADHTAYVGSIVQYALGILKANLK